MQILHFDHPLPFMAKARLTIGFSVLLFVVAIAALGLRGLNLGVDFTGGTVLEMGYPGGADLPAIRGLMDSNGFEATVQNFGTSQDVLIRMPVVEGVTSAQLSERVLEILRAQAPDVELRRVEFVGPQVGEELMSDGTLALLVVAMGITIYLALRFEWRFAVGAIVATAHDIVIVLGLYALFQWPFDLTVLAAILAVLGYSVNDTVVVFDRIREAFQSMRRADTPSIIDRAITETLSRTVITSLTTLFMVLAMLLMGGETLFHFALALALGIVIGTYSSVLVASPVVLWLGISPRDLVKTDTEKEGENVAP